MSEITAHRTVVHVAPERVGKPYENGKRLTDTYQYRGHCMCGWVGPTMATAGEARVTASAHRADVEWLKRENERAAAMVLEDTYISWA